ncbi:MAG: hypothetical protein JW751_07290 [Polyangiaceae bacterium]|nr:hypothetical protein [Polyangiaceae bacterium]
MLLDVNRACHACHRVDEEELLARVDATPGRNHGLLEWSGATVERLSQAVADAKVGGATPERSLPPPVAPGNHWQHCPPGQPPTRCRTLTELPGPSTRGAPSEPPIESARVGGTRATLALLRYHWLLVEKVLRVYDTFEAAEEADLDEWLAVPQVERLRIGEALREEAFPHHEPGFQRVLRLVEREPGRVPDRGGSGV